MYPVDRDTVLTPSGIKAQTLAEGNAWRWKHTICTTSILFRGKALNSLNILCKGFLRYIVQDTHTKKKTHFHTLFRGQRSGTTILRPVFLWIFSIAQYKTFGVLQSSLCINNIFYCTVCTVHSVQVRNKQIVTVIIPCISHKKLKRRWTVVLLAVKKTVNNISFWLACLIVRKTIFRFFLKLCAISCFFLEKTDCNINTWK